MLFVNEVLHSLIVQECIDTCSIRPGFRGVHSDPELCAPGRNVIGKKAVGQYRNDGDNHERCFKVKRQYDADQGNLKRRRDDAEYNVPQKAIDAARTAFNVS